MFKMSAKEHRAAARAALSGRWGVAIGAGLVATAIIGGGGGGGGYTLTSLKNSLSSNIDYAIDIGAGGGSASNGASTNAFSLTAKGGGGGGNKNSMTEVERMIDRQNQIQAIQGHTKNLYSAQASYISFAIQHIHKPRSATCANCKCWPGGNYGGFAPSKYKIPLFCC